MMRCPCHRPRHPYHHHLDHTTCTAMNALRQPFKTLGRQANSTGAISKALRANPSSIWLPRRCSGPSPSGLTRTNTQSARVVQTSTTGVLAMGAGGNAEMILGILTYGGSWLHSAINYTTLAISLWPVLLQHSHACRSIEGRVSTIRAKWAAYLVFLFAFQVRRQVPVPVPPRAPVYPPQSARHSGLEQLPQTVSGT